MSLTLEAIRECEDRPAREVDVPEWGGVVYVRELSALDAQKAREFHDKPNMLALYAALLVCDGDGQPLFTQDDAAWLQDKNANVLGRIVQAGRVFNSIGDDQAKETEKN